jgi:hypothetical protein
MIKFRRDEFLLLNQDVVIEVDWSKLHNQLLVSLILPLLFCLYKK